MFHWPFRPQATNASSSAPRPEGIALVVGLGNPGKEYLRTRHNVGFMAVEQLASRVGFRVDRKFRRAVIGTWSSPAGSVIIARPQTFMNLSGESAAAICQFYHLKPEQVLVVCDDVNIPFGRLRIRPSGSEGGHNGLKSITSCLGTRDYPRLRIGVGPLPPRWEMINFVLGGFPDNEWKELPEILDRAANAIELIVQEGIEKAMSRFNG